MDYSRMNEINRIAYLIDACSQVVEVLSRAQRLGINNTGAGLFHSTVSPSFFGTPVQGIGFDPYRVDVGFRHSPYGVLPLAYGWTGGSLPTVMDPLFASQTGLTHTMPTTGLWNGLPYPTEIDRAFLARSQYPQYAPTWRPFI